CRLCPLRVGLSEFPRGARFQYDSRRTRIRARAARCRARDGASLAAMNREPADDERWMAAALAFGRRSLGLAAPNPSVGALLLDKGVVIGRGVTGQGGR